MAIGSQSAEAIKLAIGTASDIGEQLSTRIRGRDLMSGLPRELELGSEEVRRAIDAPLTDIMASVHDTLEETPPELAADIARHGIVLAGGGALLRGFSERVGHETGMPVTIADAPLTCVASGAGQSLEELDRLGRRGVA
jgi:rod shape-determining protein MreB